MGDVPMRTVIELTFERFGWGREGLGAVAGEGPSLSDSGTRALTVPAGALLPAALSAERRFDLVGTGSNAGAAGAGRIRGGEEGGPRGKPLLGVGPHPCVAERLSSLCLSRRSRLP